MTKLEFLAAFRSACEALPMALTEAAIADYERQFTDQFLTGVAEQVIVDRWGAPSQAAMKLKLGTLNGNLKQVVSVEKVARVGMSGLGLVVMDFFLLIPGAIYLALMIALYAGSLAVYLSGIFVSASSLAGVNYIDVPAYYLMNDHSVKGTTHLDIGSVEIESTDISAEHGADKKTQSDGNSADHPPHFLRDKGFHIATHIGRGSLWKGVSSTLAGMMLLVLCLLATRFTFGLLRQFVAWHFSVLKNA